MHAPGTYNSKGGIPKFYMFAPHIMFFVTHSFPQARIFHGVEGLVAAWRSCCNANDS